MNETKTAGLPTKAQIINQIYSRLGEESRECHAWRGMRRSDRVVLLRAASLSYQRIECHWGELREVERQAIRAAARRAAEWVRKLEILPAEPAHNDVQAAASVLPKWIGGQRQQAQEAEA